MDKVVGKRSVNMLRGGRWGTRVFLGGKLQERRGLDRSDVGT